MSELSRLLIQNGYTIKSEVSATGNALQLKAYHGDEFVIIDFTPGETLLLSAGDEPGWEQLLARTRPICTQFMKAEPICAYDAKVMFANTHYLEWNIACPERHLHQLVNRLGDYAVIEVSNLQLFGKYQLNDFVDKEARWICAEANRARRVYAGVYGKDPATCDVVRLSKANELELFLEYTMALSAKVDAELYAQQTFGGNQDILLAWMGGVMLETQMRILDLALDYIINAICQKAKIAILSEPSKQHRLQVDETSFYKWYNFYGEHLQRVCPSQKSLDELAKKYQLGEDISDYAPTADWHTF